VVDHHCHPWSEDTKEITKELYVSLMNMGGLSGEEARDPENVIHAEFTPMGRQIAHLLAKFLGASSSSNLSEIIEARNKRSRADYKAYCRELFVDAGIDGLFVDDGYSEVAVASGLAKRDFQEFEEEISPVPVRRVARIEPRFQIAIDESKDYDDFLKIFDQSLSVAVKREKAIAFKSIIAYRSGLHIQKPNEEDVRKDYARSKTARERGVKNIRDWYVRHVISRFPDLQTPLHLHCGMGDTDVVFDKCNPSQLYELLTDRETWKTKIFLIHGGYPFSQEAAFFANALKNVYVDLSEMIPFASVVGAAEKCAQVLDMAPPSRVVFGSDGIVIPEVHWAGAKIGRRVLARALEKFVAEEVYDEDEAHRIAKMVLSENAKRIYKPW
jgi:predicted TIM-barrel fold metal-dependent hydrolase